MGSGGVWCEHGLIRGWTWANNGRLSAIMRRFGAILGLYWAILGCIGAIGAAWFSHFVRIVVHCRSFFGWCFWLVSAVFGWTCCSLSAVFVVASDHSEWELVLPGCNVVTAFWRSLAPSLCLSVCLSPSLSLSLSPSLSVCLSLSRCLAVCLSVSLPKQCDRRHSGSWVDFWHGGSVAEMVTDRPPTKGPNNEHTKQSQ